MHHAKSLRIILVWTLTLTALFTTSVAPKTFAASTIRYVTVGGSTDGPCDSWTTACDLQYALTQAVSEDELWVQQGIYYPDQGTGQTDNDPASTFTLRDGVALYGGFNGTETSRDQRDWTTNRTILSGDLEQNDPTDNGVVVDPNQIAGTNAYHVVRSNGVTASAVLDGFVVTGGNAVGSDPDDSGGGMRNDSSSPTLNNITVSGNRASNNGGGIYNSSSNLTLNNVTLSGNSASWYGGGMSNWSSALTLSNVAFNGNYASVYGGGMSNWSSALMLNNVTLSGNSASWYGGGMSNWSSALTLSNVAFNGNYASNYGGGMHNNNSSPTLTNVSFNGNYTGMYGGGMLNEYTSNPGLNNITFYGNSSYYGGGMMNSFDSSPTLNNVTFSGNTAWWGGSGMHNYSNSNPTINNSILWGDSGSEIFNDSAYPTINSSLIQGSGGSANWNGSAGNNGGGNLDTDPLFTDGYHLQHVSPAIDAGNNAFNSTTTDLDGNPRVVDGNADGTTTIDLGAYENQVSAPTRFYVNGAATGAATGLTWTDAFPTLQEGLANTPEGLELWVAQGSYYPDQGAGQTDNDPAATFALRDGVALYGGFNGTETSRDQRDWTTNRTILSGDLEQNDPADNGVVVDPNQIAGTNAYHVVRGNGVTASAVLDGFIVTAGNAVGNEPDDSGGGMRNDNSSPTLTNVTFSGERATKGGGMHNYSSNPTLTNVTFNSNSATYGGGMFNENASNPTLNGVTFNSNTASNHGGGMYNESSTSTLNGVTFNSNTASNNGGGMYNESSTSTLNSVTFNSNTASNNGGGMYNENSTSTLYSVTFNSNTASNNGGAIYNISSNVTLNNVTLSGNYASVYGGGMSNWSSALMLNNVTFNGNSASHGGGMHNNNSSPTLTNVTFNGNSAGAYGGGMFNEYTSNPMLNNVTFSANAAANGGGMMNWEGSSPTLNNVTFSGNSAWNGYGSGMHNYSNSNPTINNSILWGDAGSEIFNDSAYPTINSSLIQGSGGSANWNGSAGNDGGGNRDADPLFTNPWAGDYHLQLGSPAIDAGNDAFTTTYTDLDGNPRQVDGNGDGSATIDLGAYEYQASVNPNLPLTLTVTSGYANTHLAWSVAADPYATSYQISRAVSADQPTFAVIATTTDPLYIDRSGLSAGSYCYQVTALRADGQVAATSNTACGYVGLLDLWVPDTWGTPGSTVLVPVNIHNADGVRIAAADLWLDFDGNVLTPIGVSQATLTTDYMWDYAVQDTATGKRLKIAAVSTNAPTLRGAGSLFWVAFQVRGSAGMTSTLNLRRYIGGVGGSSLQDPSYANIPLRLHNGTFTSGTAYILGDLSGDGVVQALDALMALDIASGKLAPTPAQQLAGDTNGDGWIGAGDATMILYYATHNTWPMPSITAAATAKALHVASSNPRLSLDSVTAQPGQTVALTLRAENLVDYAGGEFTIVYDRALITGMDTVATGELAAGFQVSAYDDGAGRLHIALAGNKSVTGSGILATIQLHIAADAAQKSVTPLNLADARLNDLYGRDFATTLGLTVERQSGELRVQTDGFRLHLPFIVR